MYSPAGNLSYYNMATGRLKQKFPVMQGLEQAVLFNNNLYLAGVKDNTIYISHALSGNILSTVNAENAIILQSKSDSNLYYLESEESRGYCYCTIFFTESDLLLAYCAGGIEDKSCLARCRIRKIPWDTVVELENLLKGQKYNESEN